MHCFHFSVCNHSDCFQGVTIPSQRRFVHYYAKKLKKAQQGEPYSATTLLLREVKFETIPMFNGGTCSKYEMPVIMYLKC